jgi:hypothetical protein
VINRVHNLSDDQFLVVHSDRILWRDSAKLSFLRSFRFDRSLDLDDAMWIIGPLKERGIDTEGADPEQFTVSYWNGAAWQSEVCAIPQAD